MTISFEPARLPAAAPSPRIVGGVLKWYAGDTFRLQVDITLTDQNGAALQITSGQTVDFVFHGKEREVVFEQRFAEIENNRVVLWFTDEISALFPKGEYTYDIVYNGCERKTLAHDAPVRVE